MHKILIIEDEQELRENLTEALKARGFRVRSAEDGRAGIKQAHTYHPDLIICDIMMPQVDGYGVLNALRAEPATAAIPFIFLTAKGRMDDLRLGMNLGADDYLTKPFSTRGLLKTIRARLEKQQALQQQQEQALNKLRRDLSNIIPHELRTPLVSILGFSEVLLQSIEETEPEQVGEMLRAIMVSGRRLERLVANHSLFAYLTLISNQPASLESLRGITTEEVKYLIEEYAVCTAERHGRRTDLRLNVAEGTVCMSDQYLGKLVKELVDNAFKFSSSGQSVCVEGGFRGNRYMLTVKDQGQGMTQQQIERVGAFLQFDRDQHEQQGLGLGLALARQLAMLHGGTLTVSSTPKQKPSFRLNCLPVR